MGTDPNNSLTDIEHMNYYIMNINYSFQGYTNGSWSIRFSVDNVRNMDGQFVKYDLDSGLLSEEEINILIPELKEFIIIGEKQNAKEKLFH